MSWHIDLGHANVQFAVRHLMVSTVRGEFDTFTGTVEFDEQYPARSTVDVQIEAASINTKNAERDAHLRSADFLDAEVHPYLYFKSKRTEQLDASHGRLIGDLTIRGVTREAVLEVEYFGQSKTPWNTTSAGFSAHTKINRKEWGLTCDPALETGGVVVGDEVKISIELELLKQVEEVEQAVATLA